MVQDIIIGAFDASKAYVVFGKASWASPFLLSNLNGTNGFMLNGAMRDQSGLSVSAAGDINHDGTSDIIIGAYNATLGAGKTYVVFGKPSNWITPFLLSSLNGINGFELDGVAANDFSGNSVATAGDINGDGIQDIIIGAPGASNSTGKAYVVFGDSPPVLVNNRLTTTQGAAVTLDSVSLSAYDLNHANANASLVFVPSALIAGHFVTINNPAVPLNNFTQAQITNGIIQFVQDGSPTTPSYNITVKTSGFAFVGPVPANISFSLSSAPKVIKGQFPAIIRKLPVTLYIH